MMLDEEKTPNAEDNECAICLNLYADEEEIMVLECDKRHFFHWQCACEWLRIKPACPLCRQDFKDSIIKIDADNLFNGQTLSQ